MYRDKICKIQETYNITEWTGWSDELSKKIDDLMVHFDSKPNHILLLAI